MSHYYYKDGTSCYEVPMASDPSKMRDTNLRDARKLDLLPSVTTYLGDMIAKKQLNKWIKKEGVKAAIERFQSEIDPDMLEESLIEEILVLSDKQVREAADFGNLIHDMVEDYAKNGEEPQDERLIPFFVPFKKWWGENVDHVYFAETTVVGDCYAGRMDLLAGMKNGDNLIIDWKTRKRQSPRTKAEKESGLGGFGTYETDALQLCAYRKAIMQHPDCPRIDGVANVFIDSENPTEPHLHRWDEGKINRYTNCWHHLAMAWCYLKNYHPKIEGGINVNV